MYLPLVRLSLPDDDVLAPVQHLVALTLKNVPADFRGRIAIALSFYGLKFDRLDARIYKRLEECLQCLPTRDTITIRREQLRIFRMEGDDTPATSRWL